jgi:hypothetical protein
LPGEAAELIMFYHRDYLFSAVHGGAWSYGQHEPQQLGSHEVSRGYQAAGAGPIK